MHAAATARHLGAVKTVPKVECSRGAKEEGRCKRLAYEGCYTTNLSASPGTRLVSLTSRRTALALLPVHRHCLLRGLLTFWSELRLHSRVALRAVPVVHHLRGNDGVEREASYESVENELVWHFLQSCEDPRKRSQEIVKDLVIRVSHAPQ